MKVYVVSVVRQNSDKKNIVEIVKCKVKPNQKENPETHEAPKPFHL